MVAPSFFNEFQKQETMKFPKLFKRKDTYEATVYPLLRLSTGAPGLFVEFVQQPDFVFGADGKNLATVLATYDCAGRNLCLSFAPRSTGSAVAMLKVSSEGADGPLKSHPVFEYELPELLDRANYRQVVALPQYLALRDTLRAAAESGQTGLKSSGMPMWGVGVVLVLGLVASVLMFSGTGTAQGSIPTKVASAPLAAPVNPVDQLSLGDQLTPTEKVILAKVVTESGIELSSGGKPFIIFSDPNCPACRELEGKLATLDKSLSPVIVPVAFKKDSVEAVTGVLCAKDVSSAWRTAATAAPGAPATIGCKKGEEQTVTNNAAFVALRFDKTPTIVTSNGKVAVGAKDFDGLMRWVKANSNE